MALTAEQQRTPEVRERKRQWALNKLHTNPEHKTRANERCRRWRANLSPEKKLLRSRKQNLKSFYGITLELYEEILNKQGGICAICGILPLDKRLQVDHDHSTGVVRGLLCHICNQGMIAVDRRDGWLDAARTYKGVDQTWR